MTRRALGTFGGPGGWAEACRALGIRDVGIELDASACATRRGSRASELSRPTSPSSIPGGWPGRPGGRRTARPASFSVPPGTRQGTRVTAILAEGIRDVFAGRKTRALRRREMAHALRCSTWGGDQPWKPPPAPGSDKHRTWQRQWKAKLLARKGKPRSLRRDMAGAGSGTHPTRAQRSAKIWTAVRSASLVIEPARFIAAGTPGVDRDGAGSLGAALVGGVRRGASQDGLQRMGGHP